ncbi:MAG: hypothetical protein OEM61_09495, partial [Desulfobacteraceae bacterium]|nr:hypothetical protein [Desulfobacteraceae bacterium]
MNHNPLGLNAISKNNGSEKTLFTKPSKIKQIQKIMNIQDPKRPSSPSEKPAGRNVGQKLEDLRQ